jgi:hypothetical protein
VGQAHQATVILHHRQLADIPFPSVLPVGAPADLPDLGTVTMSSRYIIRTTTTTITTTKSRTQSDRICMTTLTLKHCYSTSVIIKITSIIEAAKSGIISSGVKPPPKRRRKR